MFYAFFGRPTMRRVFGLIIWLFGAWNTYVAITPIVAYWFGYNFVWGFLASAILQAVLTLLQNDLWIGKPNLPAVLAIVIDTLFNAAGLFRALLFVPDTELASFFVVSFGVSFRNWTVWNGLVSIGVGFIVSLSAERLLADN